MSNRRAQEVDEKVYDRLKAEGDPVENMAALVIRERYLIDKPLGIKPEE